MSEKAMVTIDRGLIIPDDSEKYLKTSIFVWRRESSVKAH